MQDFSGKVVVIISISVNSEDGEVSDISKRGHIGEICARDFAEHGANVVMIDSNRSELDSLAASIRDAGGRVTSVQADLVSYDSLVFAAAECERLLGGVDVLVNCQTDIELSSIEDSSPESWARVISFDLLGAVFAVKAFLPLLKRSKGNVVHCGSIDGSLGNPQIPSYSAAKGGLTPLTHVMAEEFGRYGMRVNVVARGMVTAKGEPLHPMFGPLIPETPLGRPAYPHEVAAAVRFLASPEASYVSGSVLTVDGGRTGVTQGTRPKRSREGVDAG